MATNKNKKAAEEATVFTAADLIQAAPAIGIKSEIMAGALYGKETATLEEAKQLVEEFKTKGVK